MGTHLAEVDAVEVLAVLLDEVDEGVPSHKLERARGRWNENAGDIHADGVAKQVADASEGLLGGVGEGLGAKVGAAAEDSTLKDDIEELVDALVDEAVADRAERELERLRRA
jgi:hypothetical protein